MKVDPRFLKEDGVEVFLGNELLVKGLLEVEGGTHLWTGYPGSPIAGFFDCIESIHELPKKYGIHATMANNEALSVAMVNGSQMSGLRAITAMKSVGVHVASDALALGNLAGAHPQGGAVIVLGDDPWSDSTQVASDSRFLCKHLMMPVLEPSTLQELKDWVDVAFKLSRQSELYIGYLVTTNQADGGGSVRVRKNQFPAINTHHKTTLDTLGGLRVEDMVLLPPRTWRKEQDMPARVDRLWQSARSLGVNRILYPRPHGRAEIGFVTSGMAFSYLEHALNELGVTGQIPILKLGITYPLDPALISDFAQQARTLIVVEERRGFLEEQVTQIISRLNQRVSPSDSTRVYGKEFPNGFKGIPTLRGLNPSLLIDLLGPLIKELEDPSVRIDADLIDGELSLISFTGGYDLKLISRSPTFCPGCPHRDSASVLIDVKKSFMDPAYMQSTHGRGITDLVFHGDTGCYTMLMFEPNRDLMHNYSGMGLGGGTGAGIDPFITNKQVVFMGDSTFFHSGQVAISNAIKSGQDITFIILDNKTTAMTGHQPVPSVEYDLMGNPTFAQDIERVVRGMVGDNVSLIRTNPAYRESYRELLEENILRNGVKVIIADKECGITFHRRQNREDRRTIRERGFLERKRLINISTEACENCLECTKSTGCPGLSFVDTEYGRKVQTDLSWCVADMACTKLHVCPSFEEVLLTRTQKPPNPLDALDLENFPDPQPLSFSSAWRTLLSGVGGMGIATSTATLVRAGHREGYQVVFCEKNGLAIRNGGVYSQITYLQPGQNHTSQIIPYGKADLILGIDILEAARSLDPEGNVRVGSPDYTSAIINTEKTPTILTLLGREDFDTTDLEKAIKRYTKPANYFGFNLSQIAEKYFGTKLYVNTLMLGLAFQKGLLPLRAESLEWAIKESTGAAAADNIRAFRLGRRIILDPSRFGAPSPKLSWKEVVSEKYLHLAMSGGEALAESYRILVTDTVGKMRLDPEGLRLLAVRIHDCIRFQNLAYARLYVDLILSVYSKDSARQNYAATKAAIGNLHRTMVIKDEFYVAHLLTCPEKLARDRDRYQVDLSRGDRLHYTHLNKPHYEFGAFKFQMTLRTKNWMLHILKRLKFLRPHLGQWHFGPEKDFRNWYSRLLESFEVRDERAYPLWVQVLRTPEAVTGYDNVSRPKMAKARESAESLLDQIRNLPPMETSGDRTPVSPRTH